MARALDKLDALTVKNLKEPGRHSDGGGLYLVVDASGARRWVFMYRWRSPGQKGPGRPREMGLGGVVRVSLKKAREKAQRCRELLGEGKDPIAESRKEGAPPFGALADELVRQRTPGLRNAKSVARLKRALGETGYAAALRSRPVDEIETADVLGVLRPIWTAKPGTAPKVRAYVEQVLDAASAKGLRSGANPARWSGHLKHLLEPPRRLVRGHHAALPYAAVPAFVAALRARQAV